MVRSEAAAGDLAGLSSRTIEPTGLTHAQISAPEEPFFGLKPVELASGDAQLSLSRHWRGADGAQYKFSGVPVTSKGWRRIFESEFPADERQSYAFLESLSHEGAIPRVSVQVTEREGKLLLFRLLLSIMVPVPLDIDFCYLT